MNERDRNAADDWIRNNVPDPAAYSLEDSEEAGSTESYFFLRYRDSATVVYKVAVEDGKVRIQAEIHNLEDTTLSMGTGPPEEAWMDLQWYLNRILLSVRHDLRQPNLTCPLLFAASKK